MSNRGQRTISGQGNSVQAGATDRRVEEEAMHIYTPFRPALPQDNILQNRQHQATVAAGWQAAAFQGCRQSCYYCDRTGRTQRSIATELYGSGDTIVTQRSWREINATKEELMLTRQLLTQSQSRGGLLL